jgi:hypothetical protein
LSEEYLLDISLSSFKSTSVSSDSGNEGGMVVYYRHQAAVGTEQLLCT